MGSFIHVYTDGGGIRECRVPDDFSGNKSLATTFKIPGFERCLLASLAASGNVASRTSNIVTITATAHGIPTGAVYVGFRFFYPGSPSLLAGWYDSVTDVTANTISFNAPGANFGSESVNGGTAYLTETVAYTFSLPGGSLVEGSELLNRIFKVAPNTANNHFIRTKIGAGGYIFHVTSPIGAVPCAWSEGTLFMYEPNKFVSVSGSMASGNSGFTQNTSLDFSADQPISVTMQLAVASEYMSIWACSFSISK